MQKSLALWRHESQSILRRPSHQLWLCLWWVLSSLACFARGSFWEQNQADLQLFFQALPWLGCFFLPFLTMNFWARDRELGTFVWFFSLPQSLAFSLLFRYLAAWQFLLLALLGTLPMVAAVYLLGKPDLGIIASSYVGCLGVLSVQLAFGMIASTLCDRRLSAYLLGMIFCLSFQLLGLEVLIEPLAQQAWLGDLRKLQALGTTKHLNAALRGVLDSRDLTYVLGLITLSLVLAGFVLQWQRRFLSLTWQALDSSVLAGVSILFLAAAVLVPFSHSFYVRWDWTEERLYTLSEGTRSIAEKLREPIEIHFYFSRSHSELPPNWKIYGQHIEELLRVYARLAPDKLSVKSIDPASGSPEELQARMLGLFSQNSSQGDPMFLGANLIMGTKNYALAFLDPEKEDQLEYELSEALVKIAQSRKPILGILSSLPLVGDQTQGSLQLRQDWAIIASLRKLYEVIEVPSNAELIPDSVSTLLIIHPKGLTDRTEYAIDQYLLQGGNLVLAVDPLCRSEMLFQAGRNPNGELSSHLPRLFAAWGLGFDPKRMVGDRARAGTVQSPIMQVLDPFQLNLQHEDFNLANPISKRLEQLRLIESGWIDSSNLKKLQWQALVRSTDQSGLVSSRQSQIYSVQQLSSKLAIEGKKLDLLGILSGTFSSAFSGPPKGSPITEHLSQAQSENAVVIFADVDFITDLQAVEKLSTQTQQAFRPINDNLALMQKAVEYVGGNRDLIQIRSSSRRPRPLQRLLLLQEQSQQRYQAEIDQVNTQLANLQERLSLILNNSIQSDDSMPSVQRDDLRRMRLEEIELRKDRQRLQADLSADGFRLKVGVSALGGLLAPLLLALVHLLAWRKRQRKTQLSSNKSELSALSPGG